MPPFIAIQGLSSPIVLTHESERYTFEDDDPQLTRADIAPWLGGWRLHLYRKNNLCFYIAHNYTDNPLGQYHQVELSPYNVGIGVPSVEVVESDISQAKPSKKLTVPPSIGQRWTVECDVKKNGFLFGEDYQPGTYRVEYDSGAYSKTPGGQGYFCSGYNIFTKSGDVSFLLGSAPTVSDPDDGYATRDAAELANRGQSTTVTLSAPGAIGVSRTVGADAYEAVNCPPVSFRITQIA